MTRHVIDRPRGSAGDAMLAAFLRIDRTKRVHPGVRSLSLRRPSRHGEARLREYLRIARKIEV